MGHRCCGAINGITQRSMVYAVLDPSTGVTATRPPFVTVEPTDTAKLAGAGFTLSATIIGNGLRTTYQWFKDNQPLAGKIAQSLFIASPVVADSGSYTCVATNAAGSTCTRGALVTMTLVLTGTSALFSQTSWAPAVAAALGGTRGLAIIHRVAAAMFIGI